MNPKAKLVPIVKRHLSAYFRASTRCTLVYVSKNRKYGNTLAQLRDSTILDVLRNKVTRINYLLNTGEEQPDGDKLMDELIAVVNYSLEILDRDVCKQAVLNSIRDLQEEKSSRYGYGWIRMRFTSFIDLIAAKVSRANSMVDANCKDYMLELPDIINYALFAMAKLDLQSGTVIANDAENNDDGSIRTSTCSLSGVVQDDNTVC